MRNRLLKYLIGLLFMSLGTVFMLKSELGVAAFDALCMGLSKNIHFSTGKCCMGLGILIIFINSIIEKKIPSVFSFLTSYLLDRNVLPSLIQKSGMDPLHMLILLVLPRKTF